MEINDSYIDWNGFIESFESRGITNKSISEFGNVLYCLCKYMSENDVKEYTFNHCKIKLRDLKND